MSLHKKLMEIQTTLIAKKNQYNSFGKYNYRSMEDILESVKPLLAKHECTLILKDDIVIIGDRIYVKATADFSDGTDTISASAFARESFSKKGMDESQITGSASSYARKYCLNGLLAIDDTKDADTMDNRVQAQHMPPPVPSKATAADKKRAWTDFKNKLDVYGIDPNKFLARDVDMNDKTKVYEVVRKYLKLNDEMMAGILDNYEKAE